MVGKVNTNSEEYSKICLTPVFLLFLRKTTQKQYKMLYLFFALKVEPELHCFSYTNIIRKTKRCAKIIGFTLLL